MSSSIGKFKLDPKEKSNKFRIDDPALIKSTFRSAQEYQCAFQVLFINTFNGKNLPLLKPAIAIAAFSCELYLKSLLLFHGIHKTGHKLKDLFDWLPEEDRNEILDFVLTERNFTKKRSIAKFR